MAQLYGYDRVSVRDIAETTRKVLGTGRVVTLPAVKLTGGQRPIVVELLTDMDADDTAVQTAKVMKLAGGSWQDSKERRDVRNVGSNSLDAGTRHIAHPVANLGYCVGS